MNVDVSHNVFSTVSELSRFLTAHRHN